MSKKEEKRELILNSAIEIFAKKGIFDTKIIDISKNANIGKGTIYEYFKSKDEIVMSVFEYIFIHMESMFNYQIDEEMNSIDIIKEFLTSFFSTANYEHLQEIMIIFLDIWNYSARGKMTDELVDKMKDYFNQYRDIFTEIVKNGQEKEEIKCDHSAEDIANSIMAFGDGLYLQSFLYTDKNIFYEKSKKSLDIFISGIKNVEERKTLKLVDLFMYGY